MFVSACIAAVAANTKGTRCGCFAVEAMNMQGRSSSESGASASKTIAARFAGRSLCTSPRCSKPVLGAAATRKSLPSFNAGDGGGTVRVGVGSSQRRFARRELEAPEFLASTLSLAR